MILTGETPIDTNSRPIAILPVKNTKWPDLEYKAALLSGTHFRITIFQKTYFASMFCFLVLYIYICSCSHTDPHTTLAC